MGGIAASTSEEQFREYFNQFGEVEDAMLMTDRETGRPRGFGFVTFKSSESVDKVMETTHHRLGEKVVEVKRAEPKHLSRSARTKPESYGEGAEGYDYAAYASYYGQAYPGSYGGYAGYPGYGAGYPGYAAPGYGGSAPGYMRPSSYGYGAGYPGYSAQGYGYKRGRGQPAPANGGAYAAGAYSGYDESGYYEGQEGEDPCA